MYKNSIFEIQARREAQYQEAIKEAVDRIMQEEPERHYPIVTDTTDLKNR